MSDERFVKDHSYLVNYDKYCILDKEQHKHLYLDEVCEKLNEQQATIEQLKSELNDCTFILCSVFGEMNYLNYKSDPVILKKYEELFDDE